MTVKNTVYKHRVKYDVITAIYANSPVNKRQMIIYYYCGSSRTVVKFYFVMSCREKFYADDNVEFVSAASRHVRESHQSHCGRSQGAQVENQWVNWCVLVRSINIIKLNRVLGLLFNSFAGNQGFHPFHFGPRPFPFGTPLDPNRIAELPLKLSGKRFTIILLLFFFFFVMYSIGPAPFTFVWSQTKYE